MPEPYIFLSHSSSDNSITQRLADDLEDAGFEVWVDFETIGDGDRWVQRIQAGVDHCAALVVVISRNARQSEWVERETVLALQLRKPVFIALVEAVPLPLQLITRQYTDFASDYTAGLERLVAALNKALQDVAIGSAPRILPPAMSPDPNEHNFFAYLKQMDNGDLLALVARDLFKWSRQQGANVVFSGKYRPAMHAQLHLNGKDVTILSVLAYMQTPAAQIPLDYLAKYPPYTDPEKRLTALAALNKLMPQSDQFDDSRANRRPTLPILAALETAEALENFKEIIQTIINDLHNSPPS